MKKIIYLGLMAFLSSTALNAQDTETVTDNKEDGCLVSKRGINILPEGGEFAIGFSATPVLNYVGNFFFTGAPNIAPGVQNANHPTFFTSGGTPALLGKYMLDENTAIRGRFNLAMSSLKTNFITAKALLTPDPFNPQFVNEQLTTNTNAVLLAGGIEKRKGKTRIQGVYGGEALLGYRKQKFEAEYGNPINADFALPNTAVAIPGIAAVASGRVTEYKTGSVFFAGVRGFAGIEWFFAPKVSLGGELGYTLGLATGGDGSVTTETLDPTTGTVVTIESDVDGPTTPSFTGIGLDQLNADLNLLFYF